VLPPHKKIHSLTTYIIALTAREPSRWTLVSLGCATDLITSGDWTVPREGVASSVLSNNDVNSASGLGGLLFQSPFSTLLLCVLVLGSSLLGTSGA
jgi:hypothetical protein